jgi:ribonucrease Y
MDLIIGIGIGIAGGAVVAVIIQNVLLKSRRDQLLKDAENEGESIKKDKILQAKEKFLQLKESHEDAMKDRERKMQSAEDRTRNKENSLSQKIEEVTRKEKTIENQQKELEEKIQISDVRAQELEKIQSKHVAELSKISGMDPEDAKKQLMEALKDEARTGAMEHIKDIVEESKLNHYSNHSACSARAIHRKFSFCI